MSMDLAEYRNLVRDLGAWAETFEVRADVRPHVTLRGATESSTFTAGDVSVYRFGKSIVVQRRLPSGRGEAYYVVRPTSDGPRLVRQGVIGRDVAPSAVEALTQSLVDAAVRMHPAEAVPA